MACLVPKVYQGWQTKPAEENIHKTMKLLCHNNAQGKKQKFILPKHKTM